MVEKDFRIHIYKGHEYYDYIVVAELCVAALCRSHMTIKIGLSGFANRNSSPR
jgi:hypothetical protein